MATLHVDAWASAAKQLGVILTGPVHVKAASGHLTADLLFAAFGAPKGTLVFEFSNEPTAQDTEYLLRDGYALSMFDKPADGFEYDTAALVELLSDWGWSGASSESPSWLNLPPP